MTAYRDSTSVAFLFTRVWLPNDDCSVHVSTGLKQNEWPFKLKVESGQWAPMSLGDTIILYR